MALTIGQIAASSYDAVLNESRKPENQWKETALLNKMEAMGMIERKSFGATLEETLDYRRNPAADFLETDLQETSLAKTEVITAASYSIAELSVPVTWSKKDEVQNPSENQKIALVKSLLTNGFDSHDDLIEEKIFAAAAYNGFNTAAVLAPTTGQGTVGGIDSSVETFWRNQTATYLSDGSDIEAQLTTLHNSCAKGSGSKLSPKLIFSGSSPYGLFLSSQQPQQRWVDSQDLKAGFKSAAFMTAVWVFSQEGGNNIYMAPGKAGFKLVVSKQYFRDKGETQEIDNANGFSFKIYSALQLVTANKSRLGVASQ